jgi:hypothetical protein
MSDSFGKRLLKNAGIIGTAMMGISIVSLTNDAFRIGWVAPAKKILEQYILIRESISGVVSPFIIDVLSVVRDLFNIRLTLSPNWADLLLLMMVYLAARVKSYIS